SAAVPHRGQGGVHAERDTVEVDAHGPAVALEVEVVADADAARNPGVQKGDVEPTVQLERARDGGRVVVVRRDVASYERAADLGRDLLAVVRVDVTQHHARAEPAQPSRNARAEAAGAAGDPGDLAVIALRADVIAPLAHPKICFVIDCAH